MKGKAKEKKIIIASILSFIILLSVGFLVYAAQTVKIQISQMPNVDIILTRAQTQTDLTDFDKKLKQELIKQNVMSESEIESGKVNIQAIDTQTIESQEEFTWEQDVSSTIGSVSFSNNGKDVVMRGNRSKPGKNAIWILPEGSQKQEFDFGYNIDYGDSFNAAGMLLRVRKNKNGTLEGYMLSFNNSGSFSTGSNGSLWHFIYDGNNNTAFRSGTDINLISNINISKSGNLNVKVSDTDIIINGGGLSSEFIYEFKPGESYGEGYGFFSDHYSHGCDSIGSFTLTNINLETQVVKKFTEVLQAPDWRDGSLRILVDVEDMQNEQFADPNELTAIIAKLMNSDVYYIGWGTNENKEQMENLIQKNDGKGIFVENSSEAAIQATVEYIKKVIKPNVGNTIIAGEAVKVEVTSPAEGVQTPTEEFPSGVWKVVHDDKYYKNPQNQYELNNIYTNELIKEFNNVGKYYIYCEDKLVTEVYAHRRPVASFNMQVLGRQIKLSSTSYDLDIEANTQNTSEQEANNGIKSEKWEYKNITNNDSGWTKISSNGIGQEVIANLDANSEYMIKLTVTDYQGVKSTATKYITTGETILKPIASFKVTNKKISMYDKLEVIDESYDPSGMELTYKWTVTKGKEEVYSGTEPLLDFSTTNNQKYGIGTYKITLIVSKNVDAQIIESDAFSQTIDVVEDITPPVIIVNPTTQEVQREDIKINVNMRDQESGLGSYVYAFTSDSNPAGEDDWSEEITIEGNEKDEIITLTKDHIDEVLYLHIKVTNKDGATSEEKVTGPYYINPYIINLQIVDSDTGIPVEGAVYTLIGEKENGQKVELAKDVQTNSNGRITIEKAKIKDVVRIKIENVKETVGYEKADYKTIKIDTSTAKIVVDNSESSQDVQIEVVEEGQTLNLKVPVERKKFNLEITNIDADTENLLTGTEFSLKENGIEIAKGSTVEGKLSLEVPIAGLNLKKEYVLEQTKVSSQYTNIGTAYLNITFDENGNVSKVEQKLFADNNAVIIEDKTQAKIIVKNKLLDNTTKFGININVTDHFDNSVSIQNSKYKIKVEGENGLDYITKSYTTDAQGNIQINGLNGTGLIRLTFIHEEAPNGYKVETVDRYITIKVEENGTISYNQASMEGVFNKIENGTIFVKLTNVKKASTNTIKVKVNTKENTEVGIEGLEIKIYKVLDGSLIATGITDENGIIEVNNIQTDGTGEVIYKLEIENDALGITPIFVINYKDNRIIDAYQMTNIENVQVNYLEKDDPDYYKYVANVEINGELNNIYGDNQLVITQKSKETGAKIQGAQYKIKMTGTESIFTDILNTNEEGQVQTHLLGEKNLKLQITQTKAADGYRLDTRTKTIVITKNSKGIYEISSVKNINKSQIQIDKKGNIFIEESVSSNKHTLVNMQIAKTDINGKLALGGFKFKVTEPTTGYQEELITDSKGYISLGEGFIATEGKSYVFIIEETQSVSPYKLLDEPIKVEVRFTKDGEIVKYDGNSYLQGNEYLSSKSTNYDAQANILTISLRIKNMVDPNLTSGFLYDLDIEKVNNKGEIVSGSKYDIEVRPYAESSIVAKDKLIDEDIEVSSLAIKEDKTTILLKETNPAIGYGLDTQIKVITLKISENGDLIYDGETTSKDLKIEIKNEENGTGKKVVKVTIIAKDGTEEQQPEVPENPDTGEGDTDRPAEERPKDATLAFKVFNKSYGDWTKTYSIKQQALRWWWYYYYYTTGSYKLDSAQKLERIFKDTSEAQRYGFNFIAGADITLETRLVKDGVVSNEIYETSKSKGNTVINDRNGTDSIYLYKDYANKTVEIKLIQNVPAYNYKRNTTDIKAILKFDNNGKIISGEIMQGNDTEDFAIGGISAQGIVDNIQYLSYLYRSISGYESNHEYTTGDIKEYNSIGQDTVYLGLLNKSLSNPLDISVKLQDIDTNDGLDGEISAISMEKIGEDQYKPLNVQTINAKEGIGSIKLSSTYANRTLRIELLQISNGRKGDIKYSNDATVGTQFEITFDDNGDVKELKQITKPESVEYKGASSNKVQYLFYNSIIYNFGINLQKLDEEGRPLQGVRIQTDSYYITDKTQGTGSKIFTYGSAKTDKNGKVKLKLVLPEQGTYKYYGATIDVVLTEYYVPDNYKAIDGIKIRILFSDTGEVIDTQIINDYKEGNTTVTGKNQVAEGERELSSINVTLKNEKVDKKPIMQITNMDSEDSLVKLGGTKYKITVWDEEEYTENNLAINEIRYSQETNENGITSINFENAHALRTMIYRLEEIKSANAYVKNEDILIRVKYDKNGKIAEMPEILTKQYIHVPNVGRVRTASIDGNPVGDTLLKLNIINELKPVFTIKINKSDLYETKIFNDNVFKATSQIKNGDGGYSEPEEERLSTNMVKNYAEIGFKTKHVSQVLLYTIYEKTGEEYTERGKIEVAFDEYGNVIDQKTSGRYIANTTYSPNTNYVNAYIKTETFRIGVKVESTNREADYSLAGYTFDIKNSKGEQSDLTIKTNSIGDVIEIIGEVYKGETITYNIKQAKNAIDYEPAKEVTLTVVFNEDGTIASCSPVTQEGKYDLVTTIKNKDTKANMSIKLYVAPSERTKINIKVQDDLNPEKLIQDVMYDVKINDGDNSYHLLAPEGEGNVDVGSCQNYKKKTITYTLSQSNIQEKYMVNDNDIQLSVTYDEEGNITDARILASDGYVSIDIEKTLGTKELTLNTKNREKTVMQIYNISNERETDELAGGTFNIIQKDKNKLYGDTKITNSNGRVDLYVGPYYISEKVTYKITNTKPAFGFDKMEDAEFTLTYDKKGKVIEAEIPERMKAYLSIEIPKIEAEQRLDIIITIKSKPLFTVGVEAVDQNTKESLTGGKYEIVQADNNANKGTVITTSDKIAHACIGKTEKGKTVTYNIIEKQAPLGYKYKNKDNIIGKLQVKYDGEGKIIEASPVLLEGFEYFTIKETTDKPNIYDVDLQIKYEEIDELNIIIENQNILDNTDKIQSTFNGQLTTGKYVSTTTNPETGLGQLEFGKVTSINSRQTLTISQSKIQGSYVAIGNIRMSILFDESGKIKDVSTISGTNYATPGIAYTVDQVGSYTIKITVKNNPVTTMNITNVSDGDNNLRVNGVYELTGTGIEGTKELKLENGYSSYIIDKAPKNRVVDYTLKQTSVDRGYNLNKNIILRVQYDIDGKIVNVYQVTNSGVADSSVIKSIKYDEYSIDLQITNKQKFEIYVDTQDMFNKNIKLPGMNMNIKEVTYSNNSVNVTTDNNGTASTILGSTIANNYLDYELRIQSTPNGYDNSIQRGYHSIRVYFGSNGNIVKCVSNSDFIEVSYGNGLAVEIKVKYIPYLNMEVNRINSSTNTPLSGRRLTISSSSIERGTINVTTNAQGKADISTSKINANNTVKYVISEQALVSDTNFEKLPEITIDVTYDEFGKAANVVVSDDRYATAKVTGDRNIELTLGSRKVTTVSIINSDYYNHTVNVSAKYEITSSKGEKTTVSSTTGVNNVITNLGSAYSGEKITYTIHQLDSQSGYEIVKDQIFTVEYNIDGTIAKVETVDGDRLTVKNINQNNSKTQPNILLQMYSKANLEVKLKATDKIYRDGIYGIGFKVRNEENGLETVVDAKTDTNGYVTIPVPPTYENRTITYTITQTNTYGGYNTIEPFQLIVSYGNLGIINENGTYITNSNNAKVTPGYSEELYKKSKIKGVEIVVTLETQMGIGIEKADVNGAPLNGVEYIIVSKQENNIQNKKIVTNANGIVSTYMGEMPKNTVIEYTISELQAPAGYRKIEDIVVKVYYDGQGRISSYSIENKPENVTIEIATDNLLNMKKTNEKVHLKFKIINDNRFTLKIVNQDSGTQKPIPNSTFSILIEDEDKEIINKTLKTDKKGQIILENIDAFGNLSIYFNQISVPSNYSKNSVNSGYLKINKSEKQYKLTYVDSSEKLNYVIDNETGIVTLNLKNDNNLLLNIIDIDNESGDNVINGSHTVKAQIGELDETSESIIAKEDNILFTKGPIASIDGIIKLELGNTYNLFNKKVIYTISTPTTPDNNSGKYNAIADNYVQVEFDENGHIKNIKGISSRVETATNSNELTMNVIIGFGNIDNYKIKVVKEAQTNGLRVNGAVFDIKIDVNGNNVESFSSLETGIKTIEDVTIEEGIIELKKLKYEGKVKVTLTETRAPEGYEGMINIPIDVEFDLNINKKGPDDVNIEVTDISVNSQNVRVDVNQITREISIIVTNEPTIKLKLNKVDDQGNQLVGMKFDMIVQEKGDLSKTLDYGTITTGTDGTVETGIAAKYIDKTIFITLKEEKNENFQEIPPITIEAYINGNGKIEIVNLISGNTVAEIVDKSEISIDLKVKNKLEELAKPYEINITKINQNDENLRIPNVLFQVKVTPDKGIPVYKAVATDKNGEINLKGLVGSGNIIIELREIEAPEGYELGETEGYFKYEIVKENDILQKVSSNVDEELMQIDNDNKIINIKVPNKTQLLGLAINKVDKNDLSLNIPNTEFKLTNTKSNVEYKAVTDNKGIAYFAINKEPGSTVQYVLQETKAANGYKLDNTQRKIVVTFDKSGKVINISETDGLEIMDKNEDYVRFVLTNTQKSLGVEPYTIKIINNDANNQSLLIPNAEFNIKIMQEVGAEMLDTTRTTDANGAIQISNINGAGEIKINIKNTSAGDGYIINNKEMTVKMNRNESSGNITINETKNVSAKYDDRNKTIIINIESQSEINKYSLILNMIDETTNDNILNNNAKFNIKLNGENIETTTNKNGQIILQGLTIPDINQFDINFTETQTPFGYEQLNETQTIRAKVAKVYDSRVLHNVEIVEGERIRIVQTSDSEIMVNILYKPTEPSEDPLYLISDVYRVTDNYVERVSNSTKVKDYLANMKSNGTMTIYDKDGNIVDESKFIGTGMIIETVKGTEKIRKTVSVIGDVTGDGEIKALDISKMKQHLIGKQKLEGAYLLAADITDDGEVKALDISKEKQAIIGKIIL